MDSGSWIRQLREERSIKSSDIERLSRSIAESKSNSEYYVAHGTLADIESGSTPSIHKIFSLAVALRMPYDQVLFVFGVDPQDTAKYMSPASLTKTDLAPVDLRDSAFRFQLNFDNHESAKETQLLDQDPRHWVALPAVLVKRLRPERYRYAIVGLQDDTMGEILPPGSLVEIDREQNKVLRGNWKSLRSRPIYLVWHDDGYSCCWCQLDGHELILVPNPLSRKPILRLKITREATVIGRAVNVWLSLEPASLDAG